MPGRLISIGDIHGCSAALKSLIEAIKPVQDDMSLLKLRWEFLDEPRQRPHFSGKVVVVGHTPQTSGTMLDLEFLRCIDTDCSRGGWLTALEVRNGDFIQVNQRGQVRNGI